MTTHIKLINGEYDSTVTKDTQVSNTVGEEVFVKMLSSIKDPAEKLAYGYPELKRTAVPAHDTATHKAVPIDVSLGSVVGDFWEVGYEIVALTAEELADNATNAAKEAERQAKKAGDVYTLNAVDYVIPFTKFDGDAIVQVETAFRYGQTLTNIEFTNGTVMPITSAELAAFGAWFAAKRNAFFQ
jgi:hypothetical protein